MWVAFRTVGQAGVGMATSGQILSCRPSSCVMIVIRKKANPTSTTLNLTQALEWEKSHGGGGDGNSVADTGKDNEPAGLESAANGGGGLGGDASAQAAAAGVADVAAGSLSDASSVTTAGAGAGVETGAATVPSGAAGAGQEHPSAGAPGMGGSDNNDGGDDGADGDSDGSQQANEEEEDEGKAARLRLANIELSSPAVVQRVAEKLQGYRLPPDRVGELRETLKGFLGTKNYHNYTNHKQATDPSCKRYGRHTVRAHVRSGLFLRLCAE